MITLLLITLVINLWVFWIQWRLRMRHRNVLVMISCPLQVGRGLLHTYIWSRFFLWERSFRNSHMLVGIINHPGLALHVLNMIRLLISWLIWLRRRSVMVIRLHHLVFIPHIPWMPSHMLLGLQDRKSTRLNSSHVSISYAVFCLKKKKNCK